MKFLHISDLHLGRKFYGLTFLPQQEKMLTQIVQLVQEEHISGVLLAGDIYDKPIPPADAVTLFDAFLTELAQLQVQRQPRFAGTPAIRQPSFGGEPHSHRRRIPWGTALCDRF